MESYHFAAIMDRPFMKVISLYLCMQLEYGEIDQGKCFLSLDIMDCGFHA